MAGPPTVTRERRVRDGPLGEPSGTALTPDPPRPLLAVAGTVTAEPDRSEARVGSATAWVHVVPSCGELDRDKSVTPRQPST